ncbi:AraC family transcriptional regulator [Pseudomonas saponiphila]
MTDFDAAVPDDLSEWCAGPDVIALRGDDHPASEFRLGTREYDWHQHARGQVFCVETGMIQVRTAHGAWLLPPQRAGWMPPGVAHQIRVSGALTGWSLLLSPSASRQLQDRPCVLGISSVLRVLVERAAGWSGQARLGPEQARISAVILDELRGAAPQPLHLPLPSEPRLLKIAQAILDNRDSQWTLKDWAAWGAMSASTLRRLMLAQTGLNFARWRQQAQLALALEMLARGVAVNQVADALGYASASNFIAMFRRAFGDSPARYFAVRPGA